MGDNGYISADAWAKGIFYSVLASIVGGASKLAIRKSWLMVQVQGSDSAASTTSISTAEEGGEEFFSDNNGSVGNPSSSDHSPPPPPHLHSGGRSSGPSSPYHLKKDDQNQTEDTNITSMVTRKEEYTASRDGPTSSYYNNAMALCLRYSGMFGMTILNPFFCVLAMNYASPSILAPFSGLTLVWIILFSEYVISERPQTKQIIAAGLIITGQIIVGIFGDHTNDDGVTLDEIVESYKQPSFQLFFVGMTLWICYLGYLMMYPPTPTLRRFAWGVASGSITGFQNFLKDSLSIIKACDNEGLSLPWYFYILASCAALTAFSGLLILTRCMKRYDATFSSSMFVGSFIISATIMASVHYHTFSHLVGIINWIMYPVGLGTLMVGLYMLVQDTEEPEVFSSVPDSDGDNPLAPGLSLPLVSRSEDSDNIDSNRLT